MEQFIYIPQIKYDLRFPPLSSYNKELPIAFGGDLSVDRLLFAYKSGIFPWYSEGDPILWWSPDPRAILYPQNLKVSHSLKKTLKKGIFEVKADCNFKDVILNCAKVRRKNQIGSWIVPEMIESYCKLHNLGFAHSIESYYDGELVGGLYGLSIGGVFFGESMFAKKDDASKVAFVRLNQFLVEKNFDFIDCQVTTEHLFNFGAIEVCRDFFISELNKGLKKSSIIGSWREFF